MKLEMGIASGKSRLASESETARSKEKALAEISATGQALQSEADALALDTERQKRRLALIAPTIAKISARLQSIDESAAKAELAGKNVERNQIVRQSDSLNAEINQFTQSLSGIEGKFEFDQRQLGDMDDERERLSLELEQRKKQAGDMQSKSQSLETELKALREQEQQIIDSSGNSYSVLQDYERKIKAVSEEERRLSRENNILERESALLRKDVADLTGHESRLTNDLAWLGYKALLEPMDVELAIRELDVEYESVKLRINLARGRGVRPSDGRIQGHVEQAQPAGDRAQLYRFVHRADSKGEERDVHGRIHKGRRGHPQYLFPAHRRLGAPRA